MWSEGYDGCFSQWGYKMFYKSREWTCMTACRSKKMCACVCACAGNTAYPHTHTHALAVFPLSFSLDGSFNESQFPTACHITPLNDLINQARHLLSLAISLFTIASSSVTQFSFLALSSSLVSPPPWPYRNAMTSPSCYKLSTFPLQSVFTERHHLPLNVQLTGFATVTPKTRRTCKAFSAAFHWLLNPQT